MFLQKDNTNVLILSAEVSARNISTNINKIISILISALEMCNNTINYNLQSLHF